MLRSGYTNGLPHRKIYARSGHWCMSDTQRINARMTHKKSPAFVQDFFYEVKDQDYSIPIIMNAPQ